jgi:hypothetical protein
MSYALHACDAFDFPFILVSKLLDLSEAESRKPELIRRAAEAWRAAPQTGQHFLSIFERHWTALPAEEALAITREIVKATLEGPPINSAGTYDPEGTVTITDGRENTLFQIFHTIRNLDPALAESLTSDHQQLAAAVRRYPDGMRSVWKEAEARYAAAADEGRPRGYFMAGSPRDFPYMKSLRQASEDSDFGPAIAHALEQYAEDTAPDNPNLAPRDVWPSTGAFRDILYRAGKQMGSAATVYLDRIPEPDLRMFAQIELAAALAGLPELRTPRCEYRPRGVPALTAAVREAVPGKITTVENLSDKGPGEPRIRCPKCNWSPGAEDRWACHCGHTWNTFDTGGVCPGCMFQWTNTQCLRCAEWSAHSDWYTQD